MTRQICRQTFPWVFRLKGAAMASIANWLVGLMALVSRSGPAPGTLAPIYDAARARWSGRGLPPQEQTDPAGQGNLGGNHLPSTARKRRHATGRQDHVTKSPGLIGSGAVLSRVLHNGMQKITEQSVASARKRRRGGSSLAALWMFLASPRSERRQRYCSRPTIPARIFTNRGRTPRGKKKKKKKREKKKKKEKRKQKKKKEKKGGSPRERKMGLQRLVLDQSCFLGRRSPMAILDA